MAFASISGVALAPGVSRNRRLYTPELIAKAAKRMQERLADPNGLPIVMRTHHDAGDDSAKIVGRITSVSVDKNQSLRYKADLYDTFHAREIANLVTPQQPALRSVSIHGYWMGDTKQVQTDEGLATTAEDLEIDAIDFTASPGVDGAIIDGSSKATESGGVLRTPISEAMEASVTLSEADCGLAVISKEDLKEFRMTRGVQYEGDFQEYWVKEAKYSSDDMKSMVSKGQAMKNASGEPSYPIADISDLKKAIRAVGRGKAGHDAIRRHIIKRAKALGAMNLIPDNWSSSGSNKESEVRLGDVTEYYPEPGGSSAGFCIDAYAGPLCVSIRGSVSPDELKFVAQRAAAAAMNAFAMMDPDSDGDIADQDDFDDQGNFLGDNDDDDMGERGTADGVSPDDSMKDRYSESAAKGELKNRIAGAPWTEEKLKKMVGQYLAEHMAAYGKSTDEAAAVNGVRGKPDAEADGMDGHSHTHAMSEGSTHTHGHMHTHESAGGSYDHTHGHTHFHLSGGDEAHTHGHDHDHATAPGDTHESTITKESVMGDTQEKAAEAAPQSTLTAEDMKLLGETIGNTMAEALRAFAEMNTPKHAAAPQETTEKVEDVAESAPVAATPKADDLAALKESLASELRREIRNELRAEILEEKGLPPRRGYRLTENDDPEEMTDAELFNKHRVDILLGQYASAAPAPAADTTQAA